jgi:hypothetical protein
MNHLIWTKKNSLRPEFCQHVIDKFEKDDRKISGKVGYPPRLSDLKKSTDMHISIFPEWKMEDRIFHLALKKGLDEYNQHINSSPHPKYDPFLASSKDAGFQIQRTYPGEYYEWHSDDQLKDDWVRTITFIWYLNDIHENGYTEFSNGTKIQPEEGKLLLFPATWTYVHRGYPPKSETKYITTGWIYGHF